MRSLGKRICIMEICITRYNNKTLYEHLIYNMKLPVSEKVKTTDAMFREWHSVKIPKLEKMIQDNTYVYISFSLFKLLVN